MEENKPKQKSKEEEPKWVDKGNKDITINLNSKNKLKKLKKDQNESEISINEYQSRIREQYKSMNSNLDLYKWANIDEEEKNANEIDNILQTNKEILNDNQILTETNILRVNTLNQLTKNNYQHSSIITTLNFHPTLNDLVVTSGLDKKVKIFKINEQEDKNDMETCINTIDMPVFSCNFLNEDRLIITGRRKHYFLYDISSQKLQRYNGHFATSSNDITSLEKCFVGGEAYAFGDKKGNCYLYDMKTLRFKYDIKFPCEINSICFDPNNINLYVAGDQGEIYIYDIRQYRNCINKINDYGNFYITCMSIAKDGSLLATGSKNGYVNVYNVDDLKNANGVEEIQPKRVFDNLTTSCDYVRFDKSSKLLGMSSKWKKNGLRIANMNTMKVYANFPSFKDRMKYPICFDFSSEGDYFGVGNDEGKGLLYKLNNN